MLAKVTPDNYGLIHIYNQALKQFGARLTMRYESPRINHALNGRKQHSKYARVYLKVRPETTPINFA